MTTVRGGRPGWLLDAMTSIGRENLDGRHVSSYDGKEDADAANEVRLLQSAGLTEGTEVGGVRASAAAAAVVVGLSTGAGCSTVGADS